MRNARVVDGAADEELVARARAGDDQAQETLLLRYRGMVRAKAHCYFLAGADRDDLVQEGMIGLYRAIGEYDAAHRTSFRTFAELCVGRQVIDAVRSATRHKHQPLNNYLSFHRPVLVDDDGACALVDLLAAEPGCDPAEQVLLADRLHHLQRHFDAVLSDLEAEVLQLHVDGRSYQEIANRLRRHTKSVDNALQRIKRKVQAHVAEWNAEIA